MQAMANITTSIAVRSGSPTRSSTKGSSASASAATTSGGMFLAHCGYSNFWMRSPNRPRGRNSSTSTISRYIEASLPDGLK